VPFDDYVDFVRQNVLTPLGIQRAKQANPFISDAVNDEVTYYDYRSKGIAVARQAGRIA
jgi:hypothetical protein